MCLNAVNDVRLPNLRQTAFHAIAYIEKKKEGWRDVGEIGSNTVNRCAMRYDDEAGMP